jgi:hypothetical protein
MDEQVISAMAKWPNVPAMRGWLRLDRRGNWHLIDRGAPGFDETLHGKGSPITSPPIKDFIERNYTHDGDDDWYWQNGPQRVFVSFELAPLVLRVMSNISTGEKELMSHCGDLVKLVSAAFMDHAGNIFIRTEHGLGVVHDMDLSQLKINESVGQSHPLTLDWQGKSFAITLGPFA